jgi:hypothetical protein
MCRLPQQQTAFSVVCQPAAVMYIDNEALK